MDGMINFIELDVKFKRIRIDNFWYLRKNMCNWYIECGTGFELIHYIDTLTLEETYQCLKQS